MKKFFSFFALILCVILSGCSKGATNETTKDDFYITLQEAIDNRPKYKSVTIEYVPDMYATDFWDYVGRKFTKESFTYEIPEYIPETAEEFDELVRNKEILSNYNYVEVLGIKNAMLSYKLSYIPYLIQPEGQDLKNISFKYFKTPGFKIKLYLQGYKLQNLDYDWDDNGLISKTNKFTFSWNQ